jgi:hypothetical protein
MSGDYEIGYGKPPVHTRFQKGHSGNPSGKAGTKKARRLRFAEMLDAWMFSSIESVERMNCRTPFAGMAQDMILGGARGKTAAIRTAFDFLDELDGISPRRRRKALDARLEEAEQAEEAANLSWNEEETNTQPMGIPQGKFEKDKPRTWCEYAQEGLQNDDANIG